MSLALLVLIGCETKELPPPPKVTTILTPFTLNDYKGKEFTFLPKDIKGPVLLNFWATWCMPCVKELPMLNRIYISRKGDGLRLIAIDVDEKPEVVKEFWETYGYSFPTLIDAGSKVTERYEVFGLPTTLFIDKNGKVHVKHMGGLTREVLYDSLDKIMP
jgi:thiol-disulfide isomerase/thioredoxin